MDKGQKLNEKWIKASILGTIWASSEIVLGSFLHNLRIPFSGNILTAIALVILISASYKWKEHGLFWRAGIICALLKTMSPSAVIFGPMVAILSEAILLEISVRFLGKNITGFLLGSILAMSWNLIQKIFNYVIFYGYNIVELYSNLMKYAQKQLHLQFDVVWAPIVLLLAIYILFGTFSAMIGIKTGRKLLTHSNEPGKVLQNMQTGNSTTKKSSIFNYSVPWLFLNIILMFGSLILINQISFVAWATLVSVIVFAWAVRYKRALRQLVKPKLWIFFIATTMVAAFVFTTIQAEETRIIDAIIIGVEMNLRAIVLIMGFSVLGTELYNPKIRKLLGKSRFKQLPLALELSLESLPSMIANIPDLKSIVRNPVHVIHQLMKHAELRLDEIRKKTAFKQKVFIITGAIGKGKTSCIKNVIKKLEQEKTTVLGIYSERIIKNNITVGYDVINVSNNKSKKFLRLHGDNTLGKIGRFVIYPNGFQMGRNTLNELQNTRAKIIVIDEIGKLEIDGGGWSECLLNLIKTRNNHLLLAVREEVLEKVIENLGIEAEIIYNVSENKCEDFSQRILQFINY
jgi:nucleoside-triphosphatase THEP1